MSTLKTQKTDASVEGFIDAIDDPRRKADCKALVELMQRATGQPPAMWGANIIGFGDYHYRYDSGREGDWFLAGLSPRKQNLALYITSGFEGYEDLISRLGKHKTGRSCLHINKLVDVDLEVLEELVRLSVDARALQHAPET